MVNAPQAFLKYMNGFMLSMALFCLFKNNILIEVQCTYHDVHPVTMYDAGVSSRFANLCINPHYFQNPFFTPRGKFTARGETKWIAQSKCTKCNRARGKPGSSRQEAEHVSSVNRQDANTSGFIKSFEYRNPRR